MTKFTLYFIVFLITILQFSCSKNEIDTPEVVPLRDYQAQFNVDNEMIERFLETHYINVVNNPGAANDQDATFGKLDATHTVSIKNQTDYPLQTRLVNIHGIAYKIYYLKFREGTGERPTNTDGVLAAYSGSYLTSVTTNNVTTVNAADFLKINNPDGFMDLFYLINLDLSEKVNVECVFGWSEIFPQFKSGTTTSNNDGTVNHTNFGAGVMFLPSGMGFYEKSHSVVSTPEYSPLIYSFKLYAVNKLDHDLSINKAESTSKIAPDGILDIDEDLIKDFYMYNYGDSTLFPNKPADAIRYAEDTDKDGVPNFLDNDDDGDGYTTRTESKRPDAVINGVSVNNGYYPFTGALIDDPTTPNIDERQGIPDCSSNFVSETRTRKYLDKNCR